MKGPSDSGSLSVAIPTFNRPEKLRECFLALAAQLTPDVPLLILDNASAVPAETALAEALREFPELDIRIVRNAYNVGANANILRCFELTESDWLWVLGDDDIPTPGALQAILSGIAANDAAICLNFGGLSAQKPSPWKTRGRLDLLTRCETLGSIVFISKNAYRARAMRKQLYVGHRYAYSMAPHFATLLTSMDDCSEVVFFDSKIVEEGAPEPENTWSSIGQALSWPTVLELASSDEERRLLAAHLQLPSLAAVVIQLLGKGSRDGDFKTPRFLYRQIVPRLFPFPTPVQRVKNAVGGLILWQPNLSAPLVDWILGRTKGASIAQRRRRDINDPHC